MDICQIGYDICEFDSLRGLGIVIIGRLHFDNRDRFVTAFTKSMETQIHVLILTPKFSSFDILLILLIENILSLLHTKIRYLC